MANKLRFVRFYLTNVTMNGQLQFKKHKCINAHLVVKKITVLILLA